MTENHSDDTEHQEVTVEAEHGRQVHVAEFPGGDMLIRNGTGDELYLTSDQARALRSALGKIDGGKRSHDTATEESDDSTDTEVKADGSEIGGSEET